MPDLDIDSLKRSIDLSQYARSRGYQERPRDAVPGITVLESATVLEQGRLGDRIAVARLASGGIYARIPDYAPRGAGESEELASRRLRDCITRSKDTGSIVEFVRSNERRAGRHEPDLPRVRDHLIAWRQASRELPLSAWRQASRELPLSAWRPESRELPLGAEPHPDVLNRRMGDWKPSPPPPGPQGRREAQQAIDDPLAQVQERIRRWQDAQRALDLKLWQEGQSALNRKFGPLRPVPLSRAPSRGQISEPALRRYDWAPPLPSLPANPLGRSVRGRGGPDRDR